MIWMPTQMARHFLLGRSFIGLSRIHHSPSNQKKAPYTHIHNNESVTLTITKCNSAHVYSLRLWISSLNKILPVLTVVIALSNDIILISGCEWTHHFPSKQPMDSHVKCWHFVSFHFLLYGTLSCSFIENAGFP